MVVFALCDIAPYTELFASYGEEWWVPEDEAHDPVPDPRILTDEEFHKLHKQYEDAIMELY